MNIQSLPRLKQGVSTFWVIRRPDPNPERAIDPSAEQLNELHQGLHVVHAGLWINTKPGEPRYTMKRVDIGGVLRTAYLVCHNGRVARAAVMMHAENYGFSVYSEPEVKPVAAQAQQPMAV